MFYKENENKDQICILPNTMCVLQNKVKCIGMSKRRVCESFISHFRFFKVLKLINSLKIYNLVKYFLYRGENISSSISTDHDKKLYFMHIIFFVREKIVDNCSCCFKYRNYSVKQLLIF